MKSVRRAFSRCLSTTSALSFEGPQLGARGLVEALSIDEITSSRASESRIALKKTSPRCCGGPKRQKAVDVDGLGSCGPLAALDDFHDWLIREGRESRTFRHYFA